MRLDTYPSSSLIVVKIHQKPRAVLRAFRVGLLPLTSVHKLLRESVAIVEVVSATAPQPVSRQVFGPGGTAAPAAGQLPLSASAAHCVHNPRCADGVGESRLSTACAQNSSKCWGANQTEHFISRSSLHLTRFFFQWQR